MTLSDNDFSLSFFFLDFISYFSSSSAYQLFSGCIPGRLQFVHSFVIIAVFSFFFFFILDFFFNEAS